MSWRNKVVWSQGMFLQPHHFQQEARYNERLIDSRVRALSPFAWGFTELQLDDSLLALGRVGIARASGIWPDGTPFAIPLLDPAPAPLDIPADLKNEIVYLALPVQREGLNEADFGAGAGSSAGDELARFDTLVEAVRDNTDATAEPEEIQTGRLRLRLLRAKELTDAYTVLGCALVAERRSDNAVLLERAYIPPQVVCDASGHLSSSLTLLHGLVRQRSHALAGKMGQLGHGVSEVAQFLRLQLLNRHEPLLRQFASAPNAHPKELFQVCLQLAGELSTFHTAARRSPDFPLYQHDDLRGCFTPVFEAIRDMLSAVEEDNAVQIELVDRKFGVRTAVVPDLEMTRSATFVLAVNAQIPGEQLRTRFPAQTKVGPVESIKELVNFNLAGITLRALPVAPRQLPFHAGYFYFELERGGELWQKFEASGNLALHVAGDFPGLEMALWAIRR
ncbi:MAG: type VI secretion system baseplate subunit TssK [Aquabacterium sp.]|uniref:type VI secretion system baseplate subunit TssK n=1 Tax=Aquabacterium sp. TaxID=1872578 RepID=UPI0025C2B392|nr:type VI secretion system baseplate subunit TssK [Aquabacterium sp.]MBI5924524.1 type VI secretion system baseplate subunit TssK [Aquabacterium sp.]